MDSVCEDWKEFKYWKFILRISERCFFFLRVCFWSFGRAKRLYCNFAKLHEQYCATREIRDPQNSEHACSYWSPWIKGTGARTEEGNGKSHTLSVLKTALVAKISTQQSRVPFIFSKTWTAGFIVVLTREIYLNWRVHEHGLILCCWRSLCTGLEEGVGAEE